MDISYYEAFGESWYINRLSRYLRERIPNIGPLTKVIPLELFLDILTNSSKEVISIGQSEWIQILERFVGCTEYQAVF